MNTARKNKNKNEEIFLSLTQYIRVRSEFNLTRYVVLKLFESGKVPPECFKIIKRIERNSTLINVEKFDNFLKNVYFK